MRLLESIVIALAVALFIIGVHQTFYYGIAASYWLFMLSLALVFYLKLKKRNQPKGEAVKPKREPRKKGVPQRKVKKQ